MVNLLSLDLHGVILWRTQTNNPQGIGEECSRMSNELPRSGGDCSPMWEWTSCIVVTTHKRKHVFTF